MPIQLFKDGHQTYDEEQTSILEALHWENDYVEVTLPTEEEIQEAAAYLGVDAEHLFVIDREFIPFFYYHNHVQCDLHIFQIEDFKRLG